MPFKAPPPCEPGKHDFHPHEHLAGDAPKPCPGRFWCRKCREWSGQRPCTVAGAPRLPAGWLKA
jgi:hypothetical protein